MGLDCMVLDSEGLSRVALGNRLMTARLKDAYRADVRVVTSSMTLIEAYHDGLRLPAWNRGMSRIVVESVTREVADAAVALLAEPACTVTTTPSTRLSLLWPNASPAMWPSTPRTRTT